MSNYDRNLNRWIIGCIILMFLMFYVFNVIISKKMKGITIETERPLVRKAAEKKEIEPEQKKDIPLTGQVARKTRRGPNREFDINVFYIDHQEIARSKSRYGKIIELRGEIPDGEVKFFNLTDETYGTEYYVNNKREGPYQEYKQETDQLVKETYYKEGEVLTSKEYYSDGTLETELDYTDRLKFSNDKETGEGKVYWRNGQLQYEWNLTNAQKGGYKRSYTPKGVLKDERIYDEFGNLIEQNGQKIEVKEP